jgi:hypothetical protein
LNFAKANALTKPTSPDVTYSRCSRSVKYRPRVAGFVDLTEAARTEWREDVVRAEASLCVERHDLFRGHARLQLFRPALGSSGREREDALVVSCDLPVGSPASVYEGITVSKGFVDYANPEDLI